MTSQVASCLIHNLPIFVPSKKMEKLKSHLHEPYPYSQLLAEIIIQMGKKCHLGWVLTFNTHTPACWMADSYRPESCSSSPTCWLMIWLPGSSRCHNSTWEPYRCIYIQVQKGLQSIILAILIKTYQNLLDQGPNCWEVVHSQDTQRLPLVNFIRLSWRWAGKAFWGLSCFISTTASPWNLSNLGVKAKPRFEMLANPGKHTCDLWCWWNLHPSIEVAQKRYLKMISGSE